MKISEILENTTNARVKTVAGNRVTIDNGDGTETTVDTQKNQDALDTDDQGNVTLNTEPKNNSAMNRSRAQGANRVRPGQRVKVNSDT